jgi:hypothetical protein
MIPAGNASRATPARRIIAEKTFPSVVIGIISPYPTVVSVTTAHQMVAGILEN